MLIQKDTKELQIVQQNANSKFKTSLFKSHIQKRDSFCHSSTYFDKVNGHTSKQTRFSLQPFDTGDT